MGNGATLSWMNSCPVKDEKIKDQIRKFGEEKTLMKDQITWQNDIDEREKVFNVREKELISLKQSLNEKEFEINKNKSFLENSLRM